MPNKAEAKTKIDEYIKEIQGVMSKPVPGVDMAALDKLIAKYPPKDKGQKDTTGTAAKGGGARKTRKRRKRKTIKRRKRRRKRRKTNKYRNKFTRRY